jgi:Ras GTPase-activating-like protein IQGAP2/3
MMTTYTRRGPGQSYLKQVLADQINALIELRERNKDEYSGVLSNW